MDRIEGVLTAALFTEKPEIDLLNLNPFSIARLGRRLVDAHALGIVEMGVEVVLARFVEPSVDALERLYYLGLEIREAVDSSPVEAEGKWTIFENSTLSVFAPSAWSAFVAGYRKEPFEPVIGLASDVEGPRPTVEGEGAPVRRSA